MAVSRLLPSGGANDFNLALSGTYTSITFNKEYASGSYSITSGVNDSTFDIYAYNSDGSLAGYTKTNSFTASKGFNKMVVLGGTTSDVLSFTYKTTFTTVDDSDEVTAGPVATSVSPSDAPKVDDTFTLTGRNFASDCTVTFTSANTAYTATQAKNIVRSSATSLIVTRPDNLPISYSPYTLTVQNPGVTNPTGSNSHILSNALTAGSAPVWVTGSTLSYVTGASTSITLSATDADAGSDIDYSIVSGTLPTGLSLNEETGVISGTPSTSQQTVTFRATDQGGNFVDKAIKFNAVPVFTTTSLPAGQTNTAYSATIATTDDTASARSFAVTSGSLPTGISMSTSGVFSGTPTVYNASPSSFTVTATDSDGGTASISYSIPVLQLTVTRFTSSGTWVAPSTQTIQYVLVAGGGGGGNYGTTGGNVGSGGGGAGGVLTGTLSVTAGTSYAYTIGGGGSGQSSANGGDGGSTTFAGLTAVGGGGGARYSGNANNGGSGGGGAASSGGAGTSGQGNSGGNSGDQYSGGGGGGKVSGGTSTTGSQGATPGNGGDGGTYLTFAVGGGGGGGRYNDGGSPTGGSGGFGGGAAGGSNNGSANTGGGGGGGRTFGTSGSGGSGCLIIGSLG